MKIKINCISMLILMIFSFTFNPIMVGATETVSITSPSDGGEFNPSTLTFQYTATYGDDYRTFWRITDSEEDTVASGRRYTGSVSFQVSMQTWGTYNFRVELEEESTYLPGVWVPVPGVYDVHSFTILQIGDVAISHPEGTLINFESSVNHDFVVTLSNGQSDGIDIEVYFGETLDHTIGIVDPVVGQNSFSIGSADLFGPNNTPQRAPERKQKLIAVNHLGVETTESAVFEYHVKWTKFYGYISTLEINQANTEIFKEEYWFSYDGLSSSKSNHYDDNEWVTTNWLEYSYFERENKVYTITEEDPGSGDDEMYTININFAADSCDWSIAWEYTNSYLYTGRIYDDGGYYQIETSDVFEIEHEYTRGLDSAHGISLRFYFQYFYAW